MVDFTPLGKHFMKRRSRDLRQAANDLEHEQRRQLALLLNYAAKTEMGHDYDFASISSAREYSERVPKHNYEDIRADVMRMVRGEKDVLWPGQCKRFAQSSGTSDGCSKFIPVTEDSLRLNHLKGGRTVVAEYMRLYPATHLFGGKSLILGGSFANTITEPLGPGVKVGDLSANLIDSMSWITEQFRVPSKSIALMSDWTAKLPALIKASLKEDVRSISGVPSWMGTFLRELIKAAGAKHLHDVWPNLEVFFHGGISFEPYRAQYNELIAPERMRYLETYNASEGFFAVQDLHRPGSMLLLPDVGVYYEFEPLEGGSPVPAWQVKQGKVYALLITAPNGLWRYALGDTVKIESTTPLRISIAGRTKLYINAFGEEVMVHNTDAALTTTCRQVGCQVRDYHVSPVFTTDFNKGRHQWLIEFEGEVPDLQEFATRLDEALCLENSDYAAKRSGTIFLDPLEVIALPRGSFERWLASTGKLGGQRKVPRLSPNRNISDAILKDIKY